MDFMLSILSFVFALIIEVLLFTFSLCALLPAPPFADRNVGLGLGLFTIFWFGFSFVFYLVLILVGAIQWTWGKRRYVYLSDPY